MYKTLHQLLSMGYGVKKKGGWVAILIVFAFAAFASRAQASVLGPGGSGSPDSLNPTGALLADTGLQNFTGASSLFSGTVRVLVVADINNPFGSGDLAFLFQAVNSASSTDSINRLTEGSFAGFLTDVGEAAPGSPFNISCSQGATTVDRSSDGSTVGFNFPIGNVLAPGGCTEALIVDTNATMFTSGHIDMLDNDIAQVASFAPAVPEPGSLVLFGAGLLGLGTFLRRRLGARA